MRRRLAASLCMIALAAGCLPAGRPSPAPLPKAGADGDDGTGHLARLSRGQMPRVRAPAAGGGSGHVGDPYGGDPYGYGYGGDVYGGGAYPQYIPLPPPTAGGYSVTSVVETGTGGAIEGVVTWKGARQGAQLPASPAATMCPGGFETRSPRVATGGGLDGAVVYLADIRAGRPAPMASMVTLDVDGCRLSPGTQVVTPIGSVLTVQNRADAATEVVLARGGAGGDKLALAARSDRQLLLDRDGIVEASVSGGHPAARAWIVVAPHPYYVATDAGGRFRLDDVPPGEYTLVVWHPPVVTGVDAQGAAVRSEARETRTKIKVVGREVSTTKIDLR